MPATAAIHRTRSPYVTMAVLIALGVVIVVLPFSVVVFGKTEAQIKAALFENEAPDTDLPQRVAAVRKDQRDDVLFTLGAALAIGLGLGLRLGANSGVAIGIGSGALVGVVTALIVRAFPLGGVGIIVPPVIGMAVGLVDGIGAAPLHGFRHSLLSSLTISLLIGLGVMPTMGWKGLIGALVIALFMGTLCGMRRDPAGRWRAGLSLPPAPLLIVCVVILTLMTALIWVGDRAGWLSIPFALIGLLLIPALCLVIARWLAIWIRPHLQVYRQLAAYLRVMWVPIGAFAIGYATLILIFAGFYGVLYQINPEGGFELAAGPPKYEPGLIDWLLFSFFTATTQGHSHIAPASLASQLLVGVHLSTSVAWTVVVFAVVMTHIGPQLQRVAGEMEGSAAADQAHGLRPIE